MFSEVPASIWKPNDVTTEPHTRLTQWQVFNVKGEPGGDDTIHFVGCALYEGRVSSPVLTYDKTTCRGITASGRIYELVSLPGYNSDAMHVWAAWLSLMDNPDAILVTDQYTNG